MTVVNGKIGKIIVGSPSATVIFDVPTYQAKWLEELDQTKEYKVDIKEVKSKKSLQQNNFAWQLMTDIARQLDIFPNAEDVYMKVMELAHIKTVFLQGVPESKKDLLRAFRCVVERDTRKSEKGVETKMYECYYGMSYFGKEETSNFIDALLLFAEENGVSTAEYDL